MYNESRRIYPMIRLLFRYFLTSILYVPIMRYELIMCEKKFQCFEKVLNIT